MTVAAHPPWTPSDAVGAALHVLRMSGTFYCSSDLRGPWGLRLPETPGCLWFHVVTSGTATIVVGDDVVTLSPTSCSCRAARATNCARPTRRPARPRRTS